MSAFSFYCTNGDLPHELKAGFSADEESRVMIGNAIVHVGHYNGTGALVVTSAGETALIMADGIRSKGVL